MKPATPKTPTKENTKKKDLLVFIPRSNDAKCTECGDELSHGRWLYLDEGKPLCMHCAGLDHLEHLPPGDAALTRRASKHSPIRAVLLQWSRARKHYERQGILVTPEAIALAEQECLADSDTRARQRARDAEKRAALEPLYVRTVIDAIRAQFPSCPPAEATRIAEWTCQKHSGRVGRSAAAKELAPHALRLAVIAHIRHEHTNYDRILMRTGERSDARAEVAGEITGILLRWETPV